MDRNNIIFTVQYALLDTQINTCNICARFYKAGIQNYKLFTIFDREHIIDYKFIHIHEIIRPFKSQCFMLYKK